VSVARSSSDGVALRYVFPVLSMTSRLAVMGATKARVGGTQRRRSITCAAGAESDVYECLYLLCDQGLIVGIRVQDYKSLCAAVTISGTLHGRQYPSDNDVLFDVVC